MTFYYGAVLWYMMVLQSSHGFGVVLAKVLRLPGYVKLLKIARFSNQITMVLHSRSFTKSQFVCNRVFCILDARLHVLCLVQGRFDTNRYI